MAEEVKVVLKRSEDSSFGFSLLGTSNLPHVIYDIIENSPAAECGVVRWSLIWLISIINRKVTARKKKYRKMWKRRQKMN